MPTIFQEKERSATETPILLFDCVLTDGQLKRWSTHKVVVSGATYQPRVLLHNLFQMQTSSDMGVDAIPKISVTLANADSHFSELERSVGWKGAKVTVTFLFFKLKDGIPETETMVLPATSSASAASCSRCSRAGRRGLARVPCPCRRVA